MAQTQQFKGTARRIETRADIRCYFYHSTAVVQVYPDGTITLNSGGWRSATTKLAMNQASNQDNLGFQVSQRDFDWFVTWQGTEIPFADGMQLKREPVAA